MTEAITVKYKKWGMRETEAQDSNTFEESASRRKTCFINIDP